MIETDEQRRWWFANHPEYSNSRKERRKRPTSGGNSEQKKVSPEAVDAYVDEALKYLSGSEAALLKSVKRHFGTEAEGNHNKAKSAELTTQDRTNSGTHGASGSWENSNSEPRPMRLPTPKEEALAEFPSTLEDVRTIAEFYANLRGGFKGIRGFRIPPILSPVKKGGNRPPARLPPKGTPERREIEAARKRGIDRKRAEELKDIKAGGQGSGVWTEKELEDIRRTEKFPIDTRWHHDPTVANRPDLAADPRSVQPLRGGNKGHLYDGHGGNYQDPRQ